MPVTTTTMTTKRASQFDFSVITPEKRSSDFASTRLRSPYSASGDDEKTSSEEWERRALLKKTGNGREFAKENGGKICCGLVVFFVCVAFWVLLGLQLSGNLINPTTTTTTTAVMTTTASTTTGISPPGPTAGPMVVASGSPAVDVTFLCKHVLDGADAGFCLAIFSYDNPSGEAIEVPIGANNYMTPGPLADDHPTTFVAGTRYGAVTSRWNCADELSIAWVLRTGDGTSVAAAAATQVDCPPLPI